MPVRHSRKRRKGALFSACTRISAVDPNAPASEQTRLRSSVVSYSFQCAAGPGSSAMARSSSSAANNPSNAMCGNGCAERYSLLRSAASSSRPAQSSMREGMSSVARATPTSGSRGTSVPGPAASEGDEMGLETASCELMTDFLGVYRIHDEHDFRAQLPERIRTYDLQSAASEEFAVLVWVDVDDGAGLGAIAGREAERADE